jgi:uracil-DNA glycosylase
MTIVDDFLKKFYVHPTWYVDLKKCLAFIDMTYLDYLKENQQYLPANGQLLNAFARPKTEVQYILLGESPYPRAESANGFAFWDAKVGPIWSDKGMSKAVNRATSLRNFIKMLLRAENLLMPGFTTDAIAVIPKANLCQNLDQLFVKMLDQGFLLLNASLVWSSDKPVSWHAKNWYPFMHTLLMQLLHENPNIKLLLFGKIAEKFQYLPSQQCVVAEHPYVLSFIENQDVLRFFKPLHLLKKNEQSFS